MASRTLEQAPVAGDAGPREPAANTGGGDGAVRAWATAHPLPFWWGVSLALAVLSAIVWPTVPSYDPWSWIVWGREVTDPHISFFIGSGPSWKPLPFLFTMVYGALGAAAPTLWVITARTGGIAGLIGAWRLSSLLCRRAGLPALERGRRGCRRGRRDRADRAVERLDLLLLPRCLRAAPDRAAALWAIDRLIAGATGRRSARRGRGADAARGLAVPARLRRLAVLADAVGCGSGSCSGWIAQPVGWFVPPWISTGQPFLAATHASEYNGELGPHPLKGVLGRGLEDLSRRRRSYSP